MKKLDLIIQLSFYLFAFVCLIIANSALFYVMIGWLFFGIWQVLSSGITALIFFSKMTNELKIHYKKYWMLTGIYFILMYPGYQVLANDGYSNHGQLIQGIYVFGVSALLAFYYTWISYSTVKSQQFLKNRSFLNAI